MDKPTSHPKPNIAHSISDEHLGAVEGDKSTDTMQGNRNAPALDEEGLPKNDVAISEDVLGATEDETQG